jgi:transaldolase
MDGWVSLEVSPLLVNNTAGTVAAAMDLHKRAQRLNLLIKIPGTPAGLAAIEETIFAGVPVNVNLLFSSEQYVAGAHSQRLLWASTGSKDPTVSDSYYVSALAAPHTINTIPEKTLLSFSKDGALSSVMSIDGVDAESELLEFAIEDIDVGVLADQLQQEGADAFTQSWNDLLAVIEQKSRESKNSKPKDDEAPF